MTPEALELSRQVIRQKSKSFYLASRLLPRRQREAATIVYAWCRRADDTVDEGSGDKRAALATLRQELDDIESGRRSKNTVVNAFADVVNRHRIPLLYPRELLRGMERDLDSVIYREMDELFEYCYQVAGTVGLMMTHIMGVDREDAVEHAAHLGVAMQLTNICRDVVEDWERGRLYLPDELLSRHGAGGLGQHLGSALPPTLLYGISRAVKELLQIAELYYRSGDEGLDHLPWRCSVAIAAARRIYSHIGEELKHRDFDVSAGRAFVPARQKLQLVGRSLLERTSRLPQRSGSGQVAFTNPRRALAFSEMPRL